jgi:uncharacterized protein YjbJ (UPF0337 family)
MQISPVAASLFHEKQTTQSLSDLEPPRRGPSERNVFRAEPFLPRCHNPEETIVDKEHVKGAADKAKGAFKDALGKMTGDKKMQVEGKFDKAKGAAHEAVGDVKDAARQAGKR